MCSWNESGEPTEMPYGVLEHPGCARLTVPLAALWSVPSNCCKSVTMAAGFRPREVRSARRTLPVGVPGGSSLHGSEVTSTFRLLRSFSPWWSQRSSVP